MAAGDAAGLGRQLENSARRHPRAADKWTALPRVAAFHRKSPDRSRPTPTAPTGACAGCWPLTENSFDVTPRAGGLRGEVSLADDLVAHGHCVTNRDDPRNLRPSVRGVEHLRLPRAIR